MAQFDRRTFLSLGAASLLATPALSATQGYQIPPEHQARIVRIKEKFAPGEIHVDPGQRMLYWTLEDNRAIRYPVGIGKEGRYISGTFRLARQVDWPRWTPTKAMIRREPHKYAKYANTTNNA